MAENTTLSNPHSPNADAVQFALQSNRGTDTQGAVISVVIPCLDEEGTIAEVLERLAPQYDPEHYEMIVVDGRSSDSTLGKIKEFVQRHPDVQVRVIDNPDRTIPAALNRGIAEARGQIIVRMDGHTLPSENYVRTCVERLKTHRAYVVGMPLRILPGANTVVARAIALAVSHPFGAGDAKYRWLNSNVVTVVDTVPFGVFHKSTWEQLGGFNENLHSNEDYDFYYRVRRAGGQILLDGKGYCSYFARPTFHALAQQYHRYGSWKFRMLMFHPGSARLRQLAAPSFLVSIPLLMLLGLRYHSSLWVLAAAILLYLILAFASALALAFRARDRNLIWLIAFAFLVVHFCWGTGFLAQAVSLRRGQRWPCAGTTKQGCRT